MQAISLYCNILILYRNLLYCNKSFPSHDKLFNSLRFKNHWFFSITSNIFSKDLKHHRNCRYFDGIEPFYQCMSHTRCIRLGYKFHKALPKFHNIWWLKRTYPLKKGHLLLAWQWSCPFYLDPSLSKFPRKAFQQDQIYLLLCKN